MPGKGSRTPLLFTPMHPSAVREVRRKFGIDLTTIFDSDFTVVLESQIPTVQLDPDRSTGSRSWMKSYDRLLAGVLRPCPLKPGFQIIVTAMDSYGSPELRESLGVDMTHILALQKRYGFFTPGRRCRTPVVNRPPSLCRASGRKYATTHRRPVETAP